MKTITKSHLPISITVNNKKYVVNHALTNARRSGQNTPTDCVLLLVKNPQLAGKRDIHDNEYQPSEFIFTPTSTHGCVVFA